MADAPLILVTGGTGQIGWELTRALAPLGRVAAPGRAELDLARPEGLLAAIRELRPALIVNAAAYTDVEGAEDDVEEARRINALAPGILAEEAARLGTPMVHYSTDYVFDGAADVPYAEDAITNPLSAYGATKLEGERAVAAAGGGHLVLRTSWVYGNRGRNFLQSVVRAAAAGDALRVVNDQHGSPSWSRLIAEATALAAARLRTPDGFSLPAELSGTYHLTAGGATTWHGFASRIVERLGVEPPPEVAPIPSSARPSRAVRPRYSVLNSERFAARFGVRLPDWETQLDLCMAERRRP